MRVDDRYLPGNQAAQTDKASGPHETGRSGGPKQADARWGGSPDQVELSDLTGWLAHALSVSAQQRAGRIEKLRQDHAEGRYRVDAAAVSRAMVAEMRAEGRERTGQEAGGKPA